MSKEAHRPKGKTGRLFLTIIGSLGVLLVVMICYFFYSLAEIRNISPQPYVTIVANNLSAKHKVVQLKAEIQNFTLNPSASSLKKMQIKARVYKSSILQDLSSKRTLRIHQQYGNVQELSDIISQLELLTALLRQVTLDNQQPLLIASNKVDEIYASLNDYLSRFVSQVQKDQMQFIQYKENFYNQQYFNLGIILVCSLVMIGIISWMYWNQSKLSQTLKERSDNLEQARLQAEQSAEAKARFLANMSHEMRTPLNAVIGLSQKEYYKACDEQTKNFASLINSSGQHLLKLINSVLDLSKIEQGKIQLEEERFYCSELIDASRTIFIEMSKPDVDVFFSTEIDADYQLCADKTKLLQVINNLSFNAVKFTSYGYVEVKIAVDPLMKQLVLTINDTGIGMTPEQLDKVFNEFTQADDSITRQYGGTGLGLSICQSLVTLMGGKISVESETQKGTSFVVSMPIKVTGQRELYTLDKEESGLRVVSSNHFAQQLIENELRRVKLYDASAKRVVYFQMPGDELTPISALSLADSSIIMIADVQTPLPTDISVTKLNKPYDVFSLIRALEHLSLDGHTEQLAAQGDKVSQLSVLVVEDMQVNQIVAEKMLSVLGISTEMANNGQECLERLKSKHFDIIFMDIQMPVMDGLETMKRIRSQHLAPNTAIIALTANTFDSDVKYYLQEGFDDVLGKPFQLDWMKEMLAKHQPSEANEPR
ncbi:signal transduction histidine kinase [Vibrio sinaloensis DSM 21326]|uniref:histidine kinase n=1 Tax=Vibrio sinaloensis DSM 21326 TaxID=945550 RepID=E8MA67_PHOS4|nr:signal transduction histidine kinase [Vibrio sinaloensis DSM 21326]